MGRHALENALDITGFIDGLRKDDVVECPANRKLLSGLCRENSVRDKGLCRLYLSFGNIDSMHIAVRQIFEQVPAAATDFENRSIFRNDVAVIVCQDGTVGQGKTIGLGARGIVMVPNPLQATVCG